MYRPIVCTKKMFFSSKISLFCSFFTANDSIIIFINRAVKQMDDPKFLATTIYKDLPFSYSP